MRFVHRAGAADYDARSPAVQNLLSTRGVTKAVAAARGKMPFSRGAPAGSFLASPAMKIWHYTSGGGGQAQTDEENLRELAEAGAIKPATMMWTHGMADWQPASLVLPALFQGAGAPPPLPATGPPPLQTSGRRSHEIDYEIIGESIQMVEIELDPGETVIAEAGAMNYMEEGISFETKMGDGSEPDQGLMGKLLSAGKRAITGESLFMTHFTNRGAGKRRVTFAAPYPGTVVPVNLAEIGQELLCQKDAFLCAAMGTKVGIAFNQRIGTGLFGGEGFILQKLSGDGMAFVHAGGTVVRKELTGGKLMVDTGCLVAFTKGVNYQIERAGNLKSMVFGGEGLFLATLQGHGSVWLQSMPFARHRRPRQPVRRPTIGALPSPEPPHPSVPFRSTCRDPRVSVARPISNSIEPSTTNRRRPGGTFPIVLAPWTGLRRIRAPRRGSSP